MNEPHDRNLSDGHDSHFPSPNRVRTRGDHTKMHKTLLNPQSRKSIGRFRQISSPRLNCPDAGAREQSKSIPFTSCDKGDMTPFGSGSKRVKSRRSASG